MSELLVFNCEEVTINSSESSMPDLLVFNCEAIIVNSSGT